MGNGQQSRENGTHVCLRMMHGGEISFLNKAVKPPRYHPKNGGDDIEPDKRHICAACQALFLFSGMVAACRAPKGERQNEDQLHICKWRNL